MKTSRLLPAALLISSLLVLTACPTIGQFRKSQARIDSLEADQKKQDEAIANVQKRVENLYTILQDQGLDLRKSGNVLSTRVDSMELELRKLQGMDEEVDFRVKKLHEQLADLIQTLDERFNLSAGKLPKDLPNNPKGMLRAGTTRMKRGRFRLARAIFRELLQRYPKAKEAPKAYLQICASYARQGNNDAALREVTVMEQAHGSSPEMAEAYLLVGSILQAQGSCKKALALYEYFLDRVPKHAKRKEVKQTIKKLKADKACK